MTAFRLVDLEEPKVADVLRQMERFQPIGHGILNRTGVIQVCIQIILDLKNIYSIIFTRKSNLNTEFKVHIKISQK